VLLFALLLQNGIVLVTRMVKPRNLASSSSCSSGSSSSASIDQTAGVHMALRVDVTVSEVRASLASMLSSIAKCLSFRSMHVLHMKRDSHGLSQ
jgi:hypothetical protein